MWLARLGADRQAAHRLHTRATMSQPVPSDIRVQAPPLISEERDWAARVAADELRRSRPRDGHLGEDRRDLRGPRARGPERELPEPRAASLSGPAPSRRTPHTVAVPPLGDSVPRQRPISVTDEQYWR